MAIVQAASAPALAAAAKLIFASADVVEARRHRDDFLKRFSKTAPKAVACLEEGFEDAMAVMVLPQRYRRRLRTTNMIERFNEEIRRRERVIRVFPNDSSALRLIGALTAEIRAGKRRSTSIWMATTNGLPIEARLRRRGRGRRNRQLKPSRIYSKIWDDKSVFILQDERGDKDELLRERLSAFWFETEPDASNKRRRSFKWKIHEAYKMRSRIVHGDILDEEALRSTRNFLDQIMRQLLHRFHRWVLESVRPHWLLGRACRLGDAHHRSLALRQTGSSKALM